MPRLRRYICNVAGLYGECFGKYLSNQPSSAFLAEGSVVKVKGGRQNVLSVGHSSYLVRWCWLTRAVTTAALSANQKI